MLKLSDESLATVHYLFYKGIQVTVFTFCRTYGCQESLLKKSVRKRCLVFFLLFKFIDVRSLRSVKMSLKFKSLSCSKNCNNVSAQFHFIIFFRGTINQIYR
jgi:hypothetical protein